MQDKKKITVLHICDYAALYRGNFIDSLASIETYHSHINNIYLFPSRAKNTAAEKWIAEMNRQETVAYMQERNPLKSFFLVHRIIKEHKVDRIIRHFSDFRVDIIIKFLFNSKNVIRFFHNGYTKGSAWKHKLCRFFWKHNKLVGVSDSIANDVQRAFPDFSVTSIVNAIHFERLDKTEPIARAEGISLLMMGWDYMRKGVDLAVKVVGNLQKKYNVTLQIIGGKNEEKIRELVRQITNDEPSWVQYLPPTNNVGTYYAASDIFLSPSRQEAFGYANVEAAYWKNSIVLSKVDGQGEIQIEGAYWFESGNLKDFEEKLEQAILDVKNEEKIAQRERVRNQVMQIYSLEEWSNKVVSLL